jgi:hypothetical protein
MKEFVGVKHLIGVPDTAFIKQEALMFDRIAVVDYSHIAPMLRESSCPAMYDYYDDLDWLLEQGIIFEPEEISPTKELKEDTEYQECMKLFDKHLKEVNKLPELIKNGIKGREEEVASAGYSFFLLNYYSVRRMTILLRAIKHMDAYPIFALPCGCSPFEPTEASKNEAVEISLKALPVPDYATPWEQIIEYRSDPDSKLKFTRLRNWMSKTAKTNNKANEIEEEFETLINEYTQHIKTHKIKTRLDTLKTVVVAEIGLFTGGWLTGVGVLPGLVGMIATPLYSIRQRQIELTAEELKAPGKEVAYIVEATESFLKHEDSEEGSSCQYCGGGGIPEP